jgi:hypothetical protein
MNKYMERGTLRKRVKSPVRFVMNNSSSNHTNGRDRALLSSKPMNNNSIGLRNYWEGIKAKMPSARGNVAYYKRTGKWIDEVEGSYNWTCGLYGCVQRFFGRGGTRRNRKRNTTLKRRA